MFTVADVLSDVKRVLGGCDDDVAYSNINHAVEILAAESEWNPLLGYLDVCVGCDRFITLPRQVGTVLAVNIGGSPSLGHDHWFKFHLNGPGISCQQTCDFHWYDGLPVATFKDPPKTGLRLAVELEMSEDAGIPFRVFGYDADGVWIRSEEDGVMVDGFLVPTVFGSSLPSETAPAVRFITRVSKPVTQGIVWLHTVDADDALVLRIGEYFPEEKEPTYRRIQLSHSCTWARVMFRKNVITLSEADHIIPLHSKYAIVLMVKAIKKWDEDRIDEGNAYMARAVKLLESKQLSDEIPGGPSLQVSPGNLIASRHDRMG
jgi:hypothetical protein